MPKSRLPLLFGAMLVATIVVLHSQSATLLSLDDLAKLRAMAYSSAKVGQNVRRLNSPLSVKIADLFHIAPSGVVVPARHLIRHFVRSGHPGDMSSVTFLSTSADLIFAEHFSGHYRSEPRKVFYHTDSTGKLINAASETGDMTNLHLIPNEEARAGFEAALQGWVTLAQTITSSK